MSAASETSPRTGDSDATSEVVIRDHGRRVRIAPDDEKKSTGGETEEETPMVPENAAVSPWGGGGGGGGGGGDAKPTPGVYRPRCNFKSSA